MSANFYESTDLRYFAVKSARQFRRSLSSLTHQKGSRPDHGSSHLRKLKDKINKFKTVFTRLAGAFNKSDHRRLGDHDRSIIESSMQYITECEIITHHMRFGKYTESLKNKFICFHLNKICKYLFCLLIAVKCIPYSVKRIIIIEVIRK